MVYDARNNKKEELKMSDILAVKTISSEEVIAEIVENNEDHYVISNARVLVMQQDQQGKGGHKDRLLRAGLFAVGVGPSPQYNCRDYGDAQGKRGQPEQIARHRPCYIKTARVEHDHLGPARKINGVFNQIGRASCRERV